MNKCRKCLLPREVSGSDLDASGLCGPCREYSTSDRSGEEQIRKRYEADLEAALQSCRGSGGEFDVLVNLSGGKDSCYLLHKLKQDYGLNVLAFTTDMNVPEVAWENIRRTIEKLDVKHIVYTPPRD